MSPQTGKLWLCGNFKKKFNDFFKKTAATNLNFLKSPPNIMEEEFALAGDAPDAPHVDDNRILAERLVDKVFKNSFIPSR